MPTAPDEKAFLDLVEATRLFVSRHDEALLSAAPARVLEAVGGLHQGLAGTLAAEAGARHREIVALGRTPPRTPGRFAEAYDRLASGDAFEREAWAFTALAKRLAEAEGALLHLRLTLSKGTADGPASAAWARRVAGETLTVQRTLAALLVVLEAWTEAARGAIGAHEGRAPAMRGPAPRPPRDALRAARECLLSGVPEGAAAPLRVALRAGLAQPVGVAPDAGLDATLRAWRATGAECPADEADVRAVDEALGAEPHDPVLAWRLLDFVEATVQRAAMTRIPETTTPR